MIPRHVEMARALRRWCKSIVLHPARYASLARTVGRGLGLSGGILQDFITLAIPEED